MFYNWQLKVLFLTEQKLEANLWLRICRYWYNSQLGDRFDWWERNRCPINACPLVCHLPELRSNPNYYSQKKELPLLKEDFVTVGWSKELLDFKRVPANTLQQVCKRVDEAFKRYIKGDSNGLRSGKPRFKSESRYRSFVIEGKGLELHSCSIGGKFLYLKVPKLGLVKVRSHRQLSEGTILKRVQFIKKADGWYVNLQLEDPTVPKLSKDSIKPDWDNSLGLDAVLYENDYLATSEGEKLPSLKSFRKSQDRLAKISKRKASKKKGSRARRKLAKRESREHQRIARARRAHAFKMAHKLVGTGKKVFFHEKLNLKGLSKRNEAKPDGKGGYLPNGQSAKSGLNKSWNDAAFGQLFSILEYIAEKAGAITVEVNHAYTSQLLSYRDEFVFTDCSIREYWDEVEKINVDRDINSAVNIKRVGLDVFPTIKKRRRGNPVVINSTTNSTLKEVLPALYKAAGKPTPYPTGLV